MEIGWSLELNLDLNISGCAKLNQVCLLFWNFEKQFVLSLQIICCKIKIDGIIWKLILTIIFYIRWRNAVDDCIDPCSQSEGRKVSNDQSEGSDCWHHAMTQGRWDSLSMTTPAGQCLMDIGTEILCILSVIDEQLMDEGTNYGKLNSVQTSVLSFTSSFWNFTSKATYLELMQFTRWI